jgi:hypothetical protein
LNTLISKISPIKKNMMGTKSQKTKTKKGGQNEDAKDLEKDYPASENLNLNFFDSGSRKP